MSKKIESKIAEIVMITLVILVLILTTSCGTSKRAGGCGGSPIHLGN